MLREVASHSKIALAVMCKAPIAGVSKTRLCPPLTPEEAAELSACFIADTAATAAAVAAAEAAHAVAVITPSESAPAFAGLLPAGTAILSQRGTDLSARLVNAAADLLGGGYGGLCFINADGPTLPPALLARAISVLRQAGDRIVVGPATDGGYTLIGFKRLHRNLFADIPWSTSRVLATTLNRAAALDVPTTMLAPWYDVDDEATLELLCRELFGRDHPLAGDGILGARAAKSRAYLDALLRADADRFRWPWTL